jgi:hypothetical protein
MGIIPFCHAEFMALLEGGATLSQILTGRMANASSWPQLVHSSRM